MLVKHIKLGDTLLDIDDGQNSLAKTAATFSADMLAGEKTVIMLGDSIAEGYGWWNGDRGQKTDENDGVMAIWRQMYPDNNFINLAVSGSTLAAISGYSNVATQVSGITGTPDYILVWAGINDVTVTMRSSSNYVGEPPVSLDSTPTNLQTTACNALIKLLAELISAYPHAKIYFITSPTADYNVAAYQNAVKKLKECCSIVGVHCIDTFSVYPQWTVASRQNLNFNRIHPGEKGYQWLEKIIHQSLDSEPVQNEKNIYNNLTMASGDYAAMNRATGQTHGTAVNAITQMIKNNLDTWLYYQNKKTIITQDFTLFGYLDIKHLHNRVWEFTYTDDKLENKYTIRYDQTTDTASEYVPFTEHKFRPGGDPISIWDLKGVGTYMDGTVPTELASYFTSGVVFIQYGTSISGNSKYICGIATAYGTGSESYIFVGYKTQSSKTLKLRKITTGADIVIN